MLNRYLRDNKDTKKRNGFTLVELLVVIVIIGILATLITVALGSGRGKARDATRVSDMHTIQTALEQYHLDHGAYPSTVTVGEPISGTSTSRTYLPKVPSNPTPRTDGDCTDSEYSYSLINNNSYHLSFCLGDDVSDVFAGVNIMMSDEIINGCLPDCSGKTCGDDGCGSTCGSCGGANPITSCSSNSCVADSYTKLMLHMNGSDNGTIFTDYSSSGHTITRAGAVTKTSVKKFGTASIYFDGNDYLTIPDNDDWNFGSGDFTIDGWVKYSTLSNTQILMAQRTSGNAFQFAFLSGTNRIGYWLYYGSSSQVLATTSNDTITVDTWHHVAVVRNVNSLDVFVDGVKGTTANCTGISQNNDSGLFYIGSNVSSYYTSGYMDEFRISKGIARWTADFTSPTEEY